MSEDTVQPPKTQPPKVTSPDVPIKVDEKPSKAGKAPKSGRSTEQDEIKVIIESDDMKSDDSSSDSSSESRLRKGYRKKGPEQVKSQGKKDTKKKKEKKVWIRIGGKRLRARVQE